VAQVVNANTIRRRLEELNWPFQISEVARFLNQQNVPSGDLVAYLDACISSGNGVDDAQIPGCSPTNGAKITLALQARGIML
jgi:hypothetical protein